VVLGCLALRLWLGACQSCRANEKVVRRVLRRHHAHMAGEAGRHSRQRDVEVAVVHSRAMRANARKSVTSVRALC